MSGKTTSIFHESEIKPSVKLNIGAGSAVLEGFTPIDRKIGTEAASLNYINDSVEEIRASHILEHFNFVDAKKALAEWVRVLKPGGIIKIAVPDLEKIIKLRETDPLWRFYLAGGQIDANDQHLSVWDAGILRAYMDDAGLADVTPWQSDGKDTSSHACSLNLQGRKPHAKPAINLAAFTPAQPPAGKKVAKICAVMSCPRLGWNDMWGETLAALGSLGIPFRRFTGAFWEQCIQNVMEDLLKEEIDIVLTLDYDSVFTAADVDALLRHLVADNDIDAIAALQVKRCSDYPLLTAWGNKAQRVEEKPFVVSTAHFGLTAIRMDALRDLPKPWFHGQPDSSGGWRGDDRIDADIWFWHQWRLNQRTVYVDPAVRIGHLEVMVSEFDENMKARHVHPKDWRESRKLKPKAE